MSDAEQDDFLKWALKGDGEEEENSNDEEEEEEDYDDVSSSKGARTTKTSMIKSTKQKTINSTGSGLDDEEWNELGKELEMSVEEQGQDDEDRNRSMADEGQENASGSLIENYEVGARVADLDRFERLAELERLEEEESQAPRGRGPGGSKLNNIFSASKKYAKHRGRSRSDDDEEEYDDLVLSSRNLRIGRVLIMALCSFVSTVSFASGARA